MQSAKGSLYKVDGEGVHGSGRVVVGLDNWGWLRVSGVIFHENSQFLGDQI